jgi:Holliday junction resolvase RusA-like endonuclease
VPALSELDVSRLRPLCGEAMITLRLSLPPSVNHCYESNGRGGRVLSKRAREWKKETAIIARVAANGWRPRSIAYGVVFFMPDHRRRDCSNLLKTFEDAIFNDGLGVDDSHVKFQFSAKVLPTKRKKGEPAVVGFCDVAIAEDAQTIIEWWRQYE